MTGDDTEESSSIPKTIVSKSRAGDADGEESVLDKDLPLVSKASNTSSLGVDGMSPSSKTNDEDGKQVLVSESSKESGKEFEVSSASSPKNRYWKEHRPWPLISSPRTPEAVSKTRAGFRSSWTDGSRAAEKSSNPSPAGAVSGFVLVFFPLSYKR